MPEIETPDGGFRCAWDTETGWLAFARGGLGEEGREIAYRSLEDVWDAWRERGLVWLVDSVRERQAGSGVVVLCESTFPAADLEAAVSAITELLW